MLLPDLSVWNTGFVVILLGAATYTDIRWRRIPNVLTLPAIGVGLLICGLTSGWQGLLLSVSGALLAPCLVSLMHGGRGPGMGDLKLAAAVGAFLGPVLGTVAMLLSMIVGGFLALGWVMREWGMFGHGRISSFVGRVYSFGRKTAPNPDEDVSRATIPYGVALAIGTLLTLVVCQWTGSESWFLCSVIGAATP